MSKREPNCFGTPEFEPKNSICKKCRLSEDCEIEVLVNNESKPSKKRVDEVQDDIRKHK